MDRRSLLIALPGALAYAQHLLAQNAQASKSLIDDLVTASHILANEGVVDGYGHVSVRHDKNPEHFLLTRSVAPAQAKAEDVVEYDADSNPVGGVKVTSFAERFIHGEIYRARPDVQSVVHTHSPGVIPFSISGVALRPVYHMAAFIGEGIPVFDIRDAPGAKQNMTVDSNARGKALAMTLGNKPGLLMRGHGAVTVGPSLIVAVARAFYLNLDAKLQQDAMALGGSTVRYLSEEEAKASSPQDGYVRAWNLWKQSVAGK